MLLKVLKFIIYPLLFHIEAFIVLKLHYCSLSLKFVNQLLVLLINMPYILDSSHLHGFEQIVAIFDIFLGLLT